MDNIVNIKFQIQKPPVFKEAKGKDWVIYGDDSEYDNRYPDFLIDLFNRCGKHNAILTGKANFIAGKGFAIDETNLDEKQVVKLKAFVDKANPDESLNDILNKSALDLELFGGFALEIIWNKAKKGVAEIHHVDFSKVRSNKDNTTFYYCKDWADKKAEITPIPAFDLDNPGGKQILYYKLYRPQANTYPYPDYMGIVPSIATDIEITNFHYNNIKTGFSAGTLINFLNGVPEPEEQKQIEKKVNGKFTGTDNAGKVILNFADGKERAAEVLQMRGNDFDKIFLQLRDDTTQEIFTGHKITSPMLFGIKSEGQLGGRNELIEAFELLQNTYITPRQQALEAVFNGLALVNGFEKRLQIEQTEPLGFQFSEAVMVSKMTDEEIRERVGLAPLPEKVTGENEALLAAINSLSPLVANKVLDSMTTNQILALVGLPAVAGGDVIAPKAPDQFGKQEDELAVFSKYGQPADNYITLKSKPARFTAATSVNECKASELDLREEFATALDIKVSPLDKIILDLISKNPLVTVEDIMKAAKRSKQEVTEALDLLEKAGAVETSEGKTGPERKLNDNGRKLLENKPPSVDIFIMYAYAGPKDDKNRAFCAALLDLNRVYSRQDIESIGAEVGRNVWETRGGWYHQANGVNRPSCRHIWEQRVTRRKNG